MFYTFMFGKLAGICLFLVHDNSIEKRNRLEQAGMLFNAGR